MPDDIKIVVTIAGGLIVLAVLCFWLATKPFSDDEEDIYDGLLDQDPENPEDEARRRQI